MHPYVQSRSVLHIRRPDGRLHLIRRRSATPSPKGEGLVCASRLRGFLLCEARSCFRLPYVRGAVKAYALTEGLSEGASRGAGRRGRFSVSHSEIAARLSAAKKNT